MNDIIIQSGPNGEIIFKGDHIEISLKEIVDRLKDVRRLEETIAEMILLGGLEFPIKEES